MHVCYLPIVDTFNVLFKRFSFSYTLIYLLTLQVIDIFISVHVFGLFICLFIFVCVLIYILSCLFIHLFCVHIYVCIYLHVIYFLFFVVFTYLCTYLYI
jgi:hypothetical protein